jgi:hypothetical protein
MDLAALEGALEAHENSDRIIDIVQSVGIGCCAVGIIVSCVALIYVAVLLRVAATTLTKDMRTVMEQIALNKVRLEEIEVRLGIARQSKDNHDANPARGS